MIFFKFNILLHRRILPNLQRLIIYENDYQDLFIIMKTYFKASSLSYEFDMTFDIINISMKVNI